MQHLIYAAKASREGSHRLPVIPGLPSLPSRTIAKSRRKAKYFLQSPAVPRAEIIAQGARAALAASLSREAAENAAAYSLAHHPATARPALPDLAEPPAPAERLALATIAGFFAAAAPPPALAQDFAPPDFSCEVKKLFIPTGKFRPEGREILKPAGFTAKAVCGPRVFSVCTRSRLVTSRMGTHKASVTLSAALAEIARIAGPENSATARADFLEVAPDLE